MAKRSEPLFIKVKCCLLSCCSLVFIAYTHCKHRQFPQTHQVMEQIGAMTPIGLEPILKRFFIPLLRRKHVLRVSVYCLSFANCSRYFVIAFHHKHYSQSYSNLFADYGHFYRRRSPRHISNRHHPLLSIPRAPWRICQRKMRQPRRVLGRSPTICTFQAFSL